MPTTRFTGRILPPALKLSIPGHPKFNWKADDLGLEITFHLCIENGSIIIDCDVNNFVASSHFLPLFMRAYDLARASVDLAAFATGNGFTVVLDCFTDPAGSTTPLTPQQPSLAMLVTAVKLDEDFDKILRIVLAEPALFMAFSDLIQGITAPHLAPVICARAVGALGGYFVPSEGSGERAWLALKEKLQISENYLRRIRRPWTPPGRGSGTYTLDAATDSLHRTWTVMNRFLEYRKRGGLPLSLSEFPLLT